MFCNSPHRNIFLVRTCHTHTRTHARAEDNSSCLDPVDTMVTNIKTTPIDIQLTGEPIGIATSHNGLFIAVAEM